jgi:enoyl-CoA hydratase/carnithine racemase
MTAEHQTAENPNLGAELQAGGTAAALADGASYFDDYAHLAMERDELGVLLVTMHDGAGGPLTFSAQDHTEFTEAFYRIGRDTGNKIVILTGATHYMAEVDFQSFLDFSDPDAGIRIFDEGLQILENLLNIHVPVIAAVEGKALIHTEYALTANVVIAGTSATFGDAPHFAGGIVPGDGVFTAWAHRAGYARAEAWLLSPDPISAETAQQWGVVAEVVEDGTTVARARELAALYLQKPEVTRRNTRLYFIQPMKQEVVATVGFGLTLEIASIDALVESMSS